MRRATRQRIWIPDGKFFFLNRQFQLAHWDDAAQTVSNFSETDFEETPVLHHLAALTNLITAVPPDFRCVVLDQVPFQAAGFSLASDAVAMDARRVAHRHFLYATEAALQLSCPLAARKSDEYALWLELRDPGAEHAGQDQVRGKAPRPEYRARLRSLRY